MTTAENLISQLNLKEHPEGGFYRETYRSENSMRGDQLSPSVSGVRSYYTQIYYLLRRGDLSRIHRITWDEVFHFYLGGPLMLFEFLPSGEMKEVILGQGVNFGERLQYKVNAGNWFGCICKAGVDFSLVGTSVAPGFDFSDLEFADRGSLLEQYPDHSDLIRRLTLPEEGVE